MSSEQRDIRPFGSAATFDHALSQLRVQMNGSIMEPRGRLSMPAISFLTEPMTLRLGLDQPSANETVVALTMATAETHLEQSDLEMLVVASTKRLKAAEIVRRIALDELTAAPIEIARGSDRPVALQAPFGGCQLDIYIALREQLEPAPLRPWRRGTWLARTSFTVVTDFGDIGFTPYPLDDEERARLRLPAGTVRYADLDNPLDPEAGQESLRLYVDTDLLASLTNAPFSSSAKLIQRQLFIDVIAAVVMHEEVRCRHLRNTLPRHRRLDAGPASEPRVWRDGRRGSKQPRASLHPRSRSGAGVLGARPVHGACGEFN